jgi:hypothetical protein
MTMPTFLPECNPMLLQAISCFTVLCKNMPTHFQTIDSLTGSSSDRLYMSNIHTIAGRLSVKKTRSYNHLETGLFLAAS